MLCTGIYTKEITENKTISKCLEAKQNILNNPHVTKGVSENLIHVNIKIQDIKKLAKPGGTHL